jgi:hypothetical protein
MVPLPVYREQILVFLLLPLAQEWKNVVFASPSMSHFHSPSVASKSLLYDKSDLSKLLPGIFLSTDHSQHPSIPVSYPVLSAY